MQHPDVATYGWRQPALTALAAALFPAADGIAEANAQLGSGKPSYPAPCTSGTAEFALRGRPSLSSSGVVRRGLLDGGLRGVHRQRLPKIFRRFPDDDHTVNNRQLALGAVVTQPQAMDDVRSGFKVLERAELVV